MKNFLILLIGFTACLPAYAQKGFHIGPEGAFNLSFLQYQYTYGRAKYDYAPTFGYAFGLEAGYNFSKYLGLQAEITTSKQGQHYTRDENMQTLKRSIDLWYYNTPILFKYSSGQENGVRLSILLGPQWSYLYKAQMKSDGDTLRDIPDALSLYSRKDFQLVFEIGSDWDFAKSRNFYGSAGLRFNYGLFDINNPSVRRDYPGQPYHATYNFTAGVNFGIHYLIRGNE